MIFQKDRTKKIRFFFFVMNSPPFLNNRSINNHNKNEELNRKKILQIEQKYPSTLKTKDRNVLRDIQK